MNPSAMALRSYLLSLFELPAYPSRIARGPKGGARGRETVLIAAGPGWDAALKD